MDLKNIERMADDSLKTSAEVSYLTDLENYIRNSPSSNVEKLENFAKYTPRQYLTYFLARYELFKKILTVHGSIVECGVFLGGGLMTFAQCSAIMEPVNHQRRVFGFDTFDGFPSIAKEDQEGRSSLKEVGGMASHAYDDLQEAIRLFDRNRFLSHMPKVELIKGDAMKTIPKFIDDNPQLVISLLYLDFSVYEATIVALKHFVPRMPKGSVIAFDELNTKEWPGETRAVLEYLGLNKLKIERFYFDSCACHAVLD